jgi:hypothetical protein
MKSLVTASFVLLAGMAQASTSVSPVDYYTAAKAQAEAQHAHILQFVSEVTLVANQQLALQLSILGEQKARTEAFTAKVAAQREESRAKYCEERPSASVCQEQSLSQQ